MEFVFPNLKIIHLLKAKLDILSQLHLNILTCVGERFINSVKNRNIQTICSKIMTIIQRKTRLANDGHYIINWKPQSKIIRTSLILS